MKKVWLINTLLLLMIVGGCQQDTNESKAEQLYKSDDTDKVIKKAFSYFDDNVQSARITMKTETEGNEGVEEVIFNFEKANTDEFAIRYESKYSNDITVITYDDASGSYSNMKDDLTGTKESVDKIALDYSELDQPRSFGLASQGAYYNPSEKEGVYKGSKKKKTINKDGTIDIVIHADVEYLNAEIEKQYEYEGSEEYLKELEKQLGDFMSKDQIAQEAFDRRGMSLAYYPGAYYTKIHINKDGFISKMTEYIEEQTYMDHLKGVEKKSKTTQSSKITKINKNKVKKDDVKLVKLEKITDVDAFTKTLTPEESEKIKDGDVIHQLPDLQTFVNKDTYYILDKETGEIRLIPLNVGYRPWDNIWEININSVKEVKDQQLIDILQAMPGFQEAKANASGNERIDYAGNGKWTY